jgi:Arc/MetJ-type ribon-helix-helix transcriptional regulator
MALTNRVLISLTDEQTKIMKQLVESGQYGSQSELFRELFRDRFMSRGVSNE